jgi:drug/metabolite transporter (DMT)-like permease
MGPDALLLVLVAAFAHALWNFEAKTVPDGGVVFIWLYMAVSALVWVPLAVLWLVLWHPETPAPTWLLGAAVSGALHIVYSITLQRGYTAADMNVVYPVSRGTGPLLTIVVSVLLLGERPPPVALAGALVVVGGVAVIATGSSAGAGPGARRAGLMYGIGTGTSIAAYTLWDDHAVNALAVPPLPYFALGLLVQCLVLAPAGWQDRERARQVWSVHRRQVVAVALLSPLAYVLVLQAMRMAPVSLVAPARESSIVVGSLLAWLVLREPHPARRLAGSVVVLVGIAALVAG